MKEKTEAQNGAVTCPASLSRAAGLSEQVSQATFHHSEQAERLRARLPHLQNRLSAFILRQGTEVGEGRDTSPKLAG